MLESREVVDLVVWTKSGEIQHWKNAMPLKYDFYSGTRNIKLLDSGQIRKLRDICIYMINGMEVYL